MSMIVSHATPDVLLSDMHERSRYSFQLLSQQIDRHDSGAGMVLPVDVAKADVLLEPFWETPNDVEGDCYASYIATHPNFGITMREGVFERLNKVVEQLPDNWQLVLKAGFRPYEVQLAVLQAFIHHSEKANPGWTSEQHLAQARTFVADPRIVCPPHTTGGAIDVDVVDRRDGSRIDMGCPPNTDDEIAFLHSDLVSPEQYKNRMTLLTAMLSAEFAPNPYEWWHYQYGETYWAAFYGHDETLYDIVNA